MTQKSTNLLCPPHTPPMSVHRPPRHHQSTPEGYPPQGPPATSTHDIPRPTSHPRDHPAPSSQTWPSQDNPYIDVDALDLDSPPRQPPQDPGPPPLTLTTIRDPPRQLPRRPPGLVPPIRELDPAHRQGPTGPRQPGQRPPRGCRGPHPQASPPTRPRPARLDPPHRVGPGPDTRHRHQPHTSKDHAPTTRPSGEGPPSRPAPTRTVGTGHRTNPRQRPPRCRPPHHRRRPPPPTYRQRPPPAGRVVYSP